MSSDRTSIIFTGDIGFDRYMDRRWEDAGLLSKPILDFFHSADHVAANVEGALIDAVDDGSRGVFFHAMNPAATRVLKDIGADIWCVVVSHGGEEFTSMPSPYTRDRYLRYLELGADVVVAHHPHVPENYELFPDGKAIFYSLGNFIFDTDYQRAHLYTDTGVLLKLIFTEEKMDFEAMGIRILRGEERVVEAPLPAIFTDIPAGEYVLLSPLAAKAFVAEDMRKMVYLEPDRFKDAAQEVWDGYFFSSEPDGYYEGAHMDFHVIVPFSRTAGEGAWKYSRLEGVKEYLSRQL